MGDGKREGWWERRREKTKRDCYKLIFCLCLERCFFLWISLLPSNPTSDLFKQIRGSGSGASKSGLHLHTDELRGCQGLIHTDGQAAHTHKVKPDFPQDHRSVSSQTASPFQFPFSFSPFQNKRPGSESSPSQTIRDKGFRVRANAGE